MEKKHRNDPIDEALRILYIEQTEKDDQHALFHDPIYRLHKLPIRAKLSMKKKELLFNKLLQRVEEVPSFGLVLKEYLQKTNFNLTKLPEEIEFPLEKLKDLVGDQLLPNRVPVRLMKELLIRLNIPFELAEKAIFKTCRMLLENHSKTSSTESLSVLYRKASGAISNEIKVKRYADQRALFENEDALRKYLDRLAELLKEEENNV